MQFLKSKFSEKVAMPGIFPDENTKISEDVYTGESIKRAYTFYTDQEKTRFFQLKIGKCFECLSCCQTVGYLCLYCPEMGETIRTRPQ
jgi:hypothetical protein